MAFIQREVQGNIAAVSVMVGEIMLVGIYVHTRHRLIEEEVNDLMADTDKILLVGDLISRNVEPTQTEQCSRETWMQEIMISLHLTNPPFTRAKPLVN